MYVLSNETESNPFAIIKNPWQHKIELAIKEEYGYETVNLLEKLKESGFPDYCEDMYVDYVATDEDGERVSGAVHLMKIVDY